MAHVKLKKLELTGLTPEIYEQWLMKYHYEPYVYDDFLQKIEWIRKLTKTIKKIEPLVGEGNEIEYKYWNDLSSWEFILNSIAIARQFGFSFSPKISWRSLIEQFRFWVDGVPNRDKTGMLFLSGASFFWDMVQFFATGRTFVNPIELTSKVLSIPKGGDVMKRLYAEEVANKLIEKYKKNKKKIYDKSK